MNRIDKTFADLKAKNQTAFVSFITGGDPCVVTSTKLMQALPTAGVDIIELGMPFTDPMADGAAIQAANLRALAKGMTLVKTLGMVKEFRKTNTTTPIVLMGYYNPIYSHGAEKFVTEAAACGVDGLIVVDLPPEEDAELRVPAQKAGIHIIRLATPTTDAARLPQVLKDSGGFIYYVSITGITGAAAANNASVREAVSKLQSQTKLPVAVGFGIRDEHSAAAIAQHADAVVVGSAIIQKIQDSIGPDATPDQITQNVCAFVSRLAAAAHNARGKVAA